MNGPHRHVHEADLGDGAQYAKVLKFQLGIAFVRPFRLSGGNELGKRRVADPHQYKNPTAALFAMCLDLLAENAAVVKALKIIANDNIQLSLPHHRPLFRARDAGPLGHRAAGHHRHPRLYRRLARLHPGAHQRQHFRGPPIRRQGDVVPDRARRLGDRPRDLVLGRWQHDPLRHGGDLGGRGCGAPPPAST